MRRRLFTFLSGLSLVLCVAACALWVRSYFAVDSYVYDGPPEVGHMRFFRIDSQIGSVSSMYTEVRYPAESTAVYAAQCRLVNPTFVPRSQFESTPQVAFSWEWLVKFQAHHQRDPDAIQDYDGVGVIVGRLWLDVQFPIWTLVLASAPLPVAWYVRWRRGRAGRLAGRCRQCGYDLRASPDRCPECGAVPAVAGPTVRADGRWPNGCRRPTPEP